MSDSALRQAVTRTSTSLFSTRARKTPRTPVAIRAAGNDRKVVHADRANIVRRISTPTAIFFAVKPPPRPIASTSRATSEDGEVSMSSTFRRSRSRLAIRAEFRRLDKRLCQLAGLWNEDRLQALPDP